MIPHDIGANPGYANTCLLNVQEVVSIAQSSVIQEVYRSELPRTKSFKIVSLSFLLISTIGMALNQINTDREMLCLSHLKTDAELLGSGSACVLRSTHLGSWATHPQVD